MHTERWEGLVSICIKGGGRVIGKHGQPKGQSSSECYCPQLVKGKAIRFLKC